MIKRIIDKRTKEKFMMDDAYLNGQAKVCGWQATLVYNSLCRHANISQESFPSIKLMAEELAVSRETIMKGVENLEKHNVIQVRKNRTKGGQWLNNTYILIDKTEWEKNQVADTDMVSQVAVNYTPSGSQPLDQVAHSHTKETHKQGNTFKETHNAASPVFSGEIKETPTDPDGNTLPTSPEKRGGGIVTILNKALLQVLKDELGLKNLDGSYGYKSANNVAKKLSEIIVEEGGELTDKNIIESFRRVVSDVAGKSSFHRNNMTSMGYVDRNWEKICNEYTS